MCLFCLRFGSDQNDSDDSSEDLKEDCNAAVFQDSLGVFTETGVCLCCVNLKSCLWNFILLFAWQLRSNNESWLFSHLYPIYNLFFSFRCHFTILSGRQPWLPRNPDWGKVSEITPTSQLVPFFIYGVHKCLPGDDGHPRTAECKNHWNDGQSQYPDSVRKLCLCGCVSNWTINIAVQLVYSTYL